MDKADAVEKARRGLRALSLEAPEPVVRDLTALVESAFAALRSPQEDAGDGWRPIEAAPKDGTRIICWGPRLSVAECEWRPAWAGYPAGWYRSNQPPEVHPTHWMPLPAPPEAPDA